MNNESIAQTSVTNSVTVNPIAAIRSCGVNRAQRDAVRETWLPSIPFYYRFFSEEQTSEADVVRVHCPSGRDMLTRKTHEIYRWCLENTKFTHLFLVNDTAYVAGERLLGSGFDQHEYTGSMQFDLNYWTCWIDDTAMWLSRRAVQIIVSDGRLAQVERGDCDVVTADILRGRVKFHPDMRYIVRRSGGPDPLPGNEQLVSKVHTPEAIRFLHQAFQRDFHKPI